MDIELANIQNEKLKNCKLEYTIRTVGMQFYFAFLDKYKYVVEADGEKMITDWLVKHITLLIENDTKHKPDGEFMHYFLSYFSSYVYDFEIINEPEIADLVLRRYHEYKLLHIDQGETEEKAWKECFVRKYKPTKEMKNILGPAYKTIPDLKPVYEDAIKYILFYKDYFQLYTLLDEEKLLEVLEELFTIDNKFFISLFETEIPQVLVYCNNAWKLSIPNLIMACTGMFLSWQDEHIIVNN
jgi:hypothetical protein